MANVKQHGVWGIDLGQCALKAIRLEEIDGEIKATAFDYIEHPKILSQPDADPDQLTREALEKFLSNNDIHGDLVSISVPGQSGLARFVKLPPVDEKKIPDIVKFEAKQQIPFPLHEVVWGFQRLGKGTTSDNMVLDAEVGLFAMKRDMVNRYLQHFKDVDVEIHYIQMAPLALCNFLAHDRLGKGAAGTGADGEEEESDKSCVVGLDIGTDNSNLVITDGEKIIWQRPIPLGGNHFTRALSKDLKLTFAKAEHLKRNAVKSPDLKKILGALKPVLNDFVSEVQRSLGYFTNTHRDATIQYMLGMGNAFRLPGLQRYLQDKLQLEVRKLQKVERLHGEDEVTAAPQYVENVPSFGVAHGLALQGLGATRIHTNLLPPEIAAERAVRAKKPWVVAAAAVLLLLTPPLLLGYAATKSSWSNPNVAAAADSIKKVVEAGKKDVNEFSRLEQEAAQSRKKLLDLAGSSGDRLSWIHLNNIINEALPRPDGTRLVPKARNGGRVYNDYFLASLEQKMPGQKAYKQWQILHGLAAPDSESGQEVISEEEVKKHLVQVNIEGMAALYSDNLPVDFFTPVLTTGGNPAILYGMTDLQKDAVRKKNVPKAGWIVELRGYTFHWAKQNFVLSTLVENLVDIVKRDDHKQKDENRQIKYDLHPDTEKVLRIKFKDREEEQPRLCFVFLYEFYSDPNPKPGRYQKIGHSELGVKLGYFGAKLGVGGAVIMSSEEYRKKEAAEAAIAKAKEEGKEVDAKINAPAGPPPKQWRPALGSVIGDSFTTFGGRQPDTGATKLPPATADTSKTAPTDSANRATRTEFVVMFLWLEDVPGR